MHSENWKLQIVEPMDAIRQNPQIYLPYGELNGDTLAIRLMQDIVVMSQLPVCAIQDQPWWIIASEEDWIVSRLTAPNVEAYFKSVVPFPELGDNSLHIEVVITAFAASVLTGDSANNTTLIKGDGPIPAIVELLKQSFPRWRRFVAFELRSEVHPQ